MHQPMSPVENALARLADPFREDPPALSGIDGPTLFRLARTHRVSPWIFARWGSKLALPEGFRDDYRTTLARNLVLLAEARAVVQRFAAAGVPAARRKGIALIGPVYPDEGMRPLSDIDLYVPPEARLEAAGILQAMGYRRFRGGVDRSEESNVTFSRGVSPIIAVDLHWDLAFTGRTTVPPESVFPRLIEADGELAPDVFAADLVAHLWHHAFRGLLWYLDLAMLMKSGRLDPERFVPLLLRLGMAPAGAWSFGVVHALWGRPTLPPPLAAPRRWLLGRIGGYPFPRVSDSRGAILAAALAAAPARLLLRRLTGA